ncbi:MAG: bi-domain-containing oxidoreductase, partial [Dehalococcoidia bacterium]
GILVAVDYSLISSGTEKAKAQLAGQNLAAKAMARPDLVRQVLENARSEGVAGTYRKVQNRLAAPGLLGYSAAGKVIAVGREVTEFRPGERVACGGAGYANHAEVISVPRNLAAHIPEAAGVRAAAFGTVGAIALHGLRTTGATLGERVGIVGLGLVGQLAAQMAAAAGCQVFGTDLSEERVKLAQALGMTGVLDSPEMVDHVIVCASADSEAPLRKAIESCRERGRVVVVGDVPVAAEREALYRKELTLTVSRSYGAGRYDQQYEELGHDYPRAYVRWTEQRNIGAVLDLIARGRITVEQLVSAEYPVEQAADAYQALEGGALALLLRYAPERLHELAPPVHTTPAPASRIGIGLVGTGNFARDRLLPALRAESGVELRGVASGSGVTAAALAEDLGGVQAYGSIEEMLDRAELNAVVIATPHDTHSRLAIEAAGRDCYVYLEKPLALTAEEIQELLTALTPVQRTRVMVGFNRRFSPAARALRGAIAEQRGPVQLLLRVNAGYLPRDHWTQGPAGGGRIRGEACHFVDLAAFLCGAPVRTIAAMASPNAGTYSDDNVGIVAGFADGSVATLLYAASGNRGVRKEYVEAHWAGRSGVIDDFRSLSLHGTGNAKRPGTLPSRQDKGHRQAIREFVAAARSGAAVPMPFDSSVNTTLATFAIEQAYRSGLVMAVGDDDISPA